ncbi:hypothetical protein HPP92_029054 [Vanilla planifolia]|uniref:Uncharacterized protein n=1 Tax=Vanilla planifolia TaxID=51239 RepID=A0A835U2K4_VANPL|nr:hypothetical protein HPP92_029054 [Vanilla planifolia]KAG0446017.1 hypothetical protein HPP92_029043 [Vanilla planifolia]
MMSTVARPEISSDRVGKGAGGDKTPAGLVLSLARHEEEEGGGGGGRSETGEAVTKRREVDEPSSTAGRYSWIDRRSFMPAMWEAQRG